MTDKAQPKTILLVEDEALIAMQEARQLQKEGYTVATANSGEDAIATVQTAQPPIDLILMDIDLGRGRMDGTQAAQTILQTQDIPIVFLSSHTEPDIVARTEQITSYGYVVKNTGITVLAASIKMAFKLHAAHQALRASEERLRLAHKATNDVVWDWDVIHDTQQWNEAGRAVFGWSEVVEHSVNVRWRVERVHPDDRQRVDAGFVKVVNDPGVDYWQDEYRFQKADGSYADVMDRGYVLRDASGKAIRMIGAMLDISKDKRAEKALADEATRRRILVEQSSDGIVILDQDGHVYESNQKFADMLGYPLEEMRKLNVFDWEYLYPRERLIEMIRTINEKGDHFETRHRRKDGSLYDVEISTNAALFAGQKLIFCVCRDITDRKQAEEALEQARNTLAEAQKVAHLGSFEYIAATRTTVWSEEEYRIYGLDPTGPSPAYDMMLQKCIHPDDRSLLHETFTKAMQSRSVYELDHRIVRPDGSVRWVYDRAHPYFDGQGELVRYVGATLDITDRKRAEEKLRESEAQLGLVFNNSSDMHLLVRVDSEDRFIAQAINRSYANVADLLSPGSSHNIIGRDRHDFLRDIGFSPEEIKKEIPLYHQAVETHAEVQYEIEFPTPHGNFTFAVSIVPVLDQQGNCTHALWSGHDISERKRVENALRESEEKYRLLAETSNALISEIDASGKFLYVNPKHKEVLGYEADEMIGHFAFEFGNPVEEQKAKDRLAKSLDEEKVQSNEWLFKDKGGNWKRLVCHSNAYVDSKGETHITIYSFDITEHKQVETRLRDEQNRLRAILNAVGDPIFVKDNDHRIILANLAFYDIFETKEENVIGYTLAESVPENERQHFLAVDRQVLDTGNSDLREETLTVGDFTRHIVTRKIRFIEDSGEKFLVGSIHDITERKRAEEQLTRLLERLNLATRAAGLGIWDWDIQKNELVWDKQMYALYGVRPQDFTGAYEAWLAGVHPDDRAASDEISRQARLGERDYDTEFRIVWPDGTVRVLKAVGEVIKDAAGQPVRMVGVNYDITERKWMEVALRESEEKFRHIFENSLAAIYRTSPDGKILDANAAFARMVGYASPEEMMTQMTNLGEQLYAHPKERTQLSQILADQGQVDGFEVELKRKDGQPFWVLSSPRAVRDTVGNVIGYEGVFVEITERKRTENALRQALAEKDVLMRELQHRVKNSLNIVAGLISLEEMNLSDEQARTTFSNTRSRIESISAVYEQLYHSSGIDQINLRRYIRSLVEGLSRSYLSSPGKVTIETQLDDVQLDIKRAMPLGIIINELVTNALKYAFPAGHAPHDGQGVIRVELSTSGGSINLCVADNGIGFPVGKEHHAGTGLGLVEMLTQQLEGKLTIESGQGVTAWVIFGYGSDW